MKIKIYEILSESTYFGLKEFKSFVTLVQEFRKSELDHSYWDYFVSTDFEDYRKEIKEFLVIKYVKCSKNILTKA